MQKTAKHLFTFISYFIISLQLVAQNVPANQLVVPSKLSSIAFIWQGDSVGAVWEPHAALLIPVSLKNCPRTFYMQFDLGSPYTLLYKNKIEAIRHKYPKSITADITDGKMKDFSFKADATGITAKEIVVKQFDSTRIDWKNKNSIEVIGTLGVDLIDGKMAVINYPGQRLILGDEFPAALAGSTFAKFIYVARRVMLPAKVNNKATILYFDTGSSMFELLTDKETSQQLATPGSTPVQYAVKSWNKFLFANTLASTATIELAGTAIPIHSSTYIEGVSEAQVKQMSAMGIGGMTGNKLFLDYMLILDTKNQQFALKKPTE